MTVNSPLAQPELGINWVIVVGESGLGARPIEESWGTDTFVTSVVKPKWLSTSNSGVVFLKSAMADCFKAGRGMKCR